jgi:zinc protease
MRRCRLTAFSLITAAVALLTASPAALAAAPDSTKRPAVTLIPDIPYAKYVLRNGLTLLVHEDHKAPIVAFNVWYHVGSKNEKPGKTGFAHLFEHLMFNGSENYNDDYFKAVEPVGATDLNGTTNEDRTNYFENVPVSAFDRVLWLESDRMGHLLGAIGQARLDEQRGVVQNEKRQGENEPYGKAWITIAENTYPKGHPYSWSVIGSMEDLSAASLEDVKEWFRTYYGPANATIAIAGDVDSAAIRRKVERYFGDIPSGPPIIKHDVWVAKMSGQHRQSMQDRVPQARIYKAWNLPQYGSADATYLRLVSEILAGGKSSRLYKRLVYRDRIATDVAGYLDAREIGSQLLIWATAQPQGDLHAVEKALDEEIASFLKSGPTGAELERVKTQTRSNLVRGIERIGGFGGKSDILARGQVFLGDPQAYKTLLQRTLDATGADLKGAATRWMRDGEYVLEVHPFPPYDTLASDVNRKKMPGPGDPPDAPLPPTERATLKNGLKVVLARRTAVPAVQISLLLDAGFAADRPGAPGLASMTMSMLDEGTTRRTSLEIADQLASLGADLWAYASLDASTVGLSALKDKLGPALDLYADVLLHPVFPESDLQRVKRIILARIEQERVEPFSAGLRVVPALLYGEGHAYGQPLTGSGTEESVRAMTRGDLVKFHETWFRPNHATLVAVGDITMAELVPQLERVLERWKPGDIPAKNIAQVPGRARDALYLIDRPGSEQSVVLAGQLVPPKANPDEIAFQAFNDAFGGAFTSRVNMNIREEKHWSYGAGSGAVDARGQRAWFIYAPVQTDKTKETVQELMREVRGAATDRPLTPQELADAKDRQTRTFAGRWETANAVDGALEEIITFGLPEDYYSTYPARMRALTPEQVARTISKFVTPGKQVWVVIGDRAKVEAGLRELKLGDVQLLDADGKPVQSGR